MDSNKFFALARLYRKNGLREGQSYMNALWEMDPQAYSEAKGTDVDCFYDDSKVPAFFSWLEKREGK